MSQASRIQPGPMYAGSKPARDPQYLRYIKRLPCVACLKTWQIDPAHTGPHGTSQKASDYTAIPLCRKCHREFDAAPAAFAEKHHFDVPALIQMFNRFYQLKIARKAA